jgi:nitrous oxidase accessory protein NosD
LAGQPIRVGPGEEFSTIGAAVASAHAGDTVLVAPGTYSERLVIDRPLTLKGEGWPVVDGGGTGHVVEALAPLHLEGFVIRASGSNVEEEHAGVTTGSRTSSTGSTSRARRGPRFEGTGSRASRFRRLVAGMGFVSGTARPPRSSRTW